MPALIYYSVAVTPAACFFGRKRQSRLVVRENTPSLLVPQCKSMNWNCPAAVTDITKQFAARFSNGRKRQKQATQSRCICHFHSQSSNNPFLFKPQ
jgi:hypothetical protein